MRLRGWLATAGVILLVSALAGIVASTHPDGLQHVAEQAGFASQGRSGTPLVTGWLGRVAGALAVLVAAAALFWALGRRGDRATDRSGDGADRGRG
ncbi:MAG: hypothetical protein U0R80_09540 [Nocardioidaceae bacterium]